MDAIDINVLGPWAISLAIMGVGFRALWSKYNEICAATTADHNADIEIREQRIATLIGLFQEKVKVDMEQVSAMRDMQQGINLLCSRVEDLEEKIDGLRSGPSVQ
jgi:hypothetical protein